MKKILLLLGLFVSMHFTFAQNNSQIIDEITIIIKAKNEQELSRYLAPNVEITMDDVPHEYTKVQALNKLVKFIKPLTIESYDIIHISEVDDKSFYAITKLLAKSNSYSSSIYITNIKGKYLIIEISFKHEISEGNQ